MLAKSHSTLEGCCLKPINWLICKFGYGDEMNGCQYICRDRCFKPITVAKTIFLFAYFIFVKIKVTNYSDMAVKEVGEWIHGPELISASESLS